MSRIFWDTNLFVYLFEDQGERSARVSKLRDHMEKRGDELLTSALTLGEVLVKPMEEGREDLMRRYEQLITKGATVLPFGLDAVRIFAKVRQVYKIRPPDAIQLACASAANTHRFITNDKKLIEKNIQIDGIGFIQSLEKAAP